MKRKEGRKEGHNLILLLISSYCISSHFFSLPSSHPLLHSFFVFTPPLFSPSHFLFSIPLSPCLRERFSKELEHAIHGSVRASPDEWGETLEGEQLRGGSFLDHDQIQVRHLFLRLVHTYVLHFVMISSLFVFLKILHEIDSTQ